MTIYMCDLSIQGAWNMMAHQMFGAFMPWHQAPSNILWLMDPSHPQPLCDSMKLLLGFNYLKTQEFAFLHAK